MGHASGFDLFVCPKVSTYDTEKLQHAKLPTGVNDISKFPHKQLHSLQERSGVGLIGHLLLVIKCLPVIRIFAVL